MCLFSFDKLVNKFSDILKMIRTEINVLYSLYYC